MKRGPGILLAALVLAMSGCARDAPEPTFAGESPQPATIDNVLLICLDTVRADTFYALGRLRGDRLQQTWQGNALVFTEAQSTAPWTLPALGSVFSGLWPIQHGAGRLPGVEHVYLPRHSPGRMTEGSPTLAGLAAQAGLRTSAISASPWTSEADLGFGIDRGFANFHSFVPDTAALGDEYWRPMVAKWSELVGAQGNEMRSFNFVHLMEAHNWHIVSEAELDARIATFSGEQLAGYYSIAPARACDDKSALVCRQFVVYAHAVGVLRDVVARMLDTLRSKRQLDNTAVVMFSDHGEEFDDHAGDGRQPSPLRKNPSFGHGHSLYQEQLHVPLMVWLPGEPGRVVDTPVSLVDIAPSVAGWLGLDLADPELPGQLLREQSSNSEGKRVLYASHINEGERQLAARQGDDKSIWYMASDRTAYYDLASDPQEQRSASSDERVLRFDGHFLGYAQLQNDNPSSSAIFTARQLQRLQSIGYLQGVEADGVEQRGGH